MATRKKKQVFGLGDGITENDKQITGSRLPTARQVLRCLMYHVKDGSSKKVKKRDCAKLVLSKVSTFYEKANIQMIADRKACERILELYKKNAKLREILKSRRELPSVRAKIEEHEKYLSSTFVLWPAGTTVNNKEDNRFLESMKSDRVASFGSFDKLLADKRKRSQKRKLLEVVRIEKGQKEMVARTQTDTIEETESDGSQDLQENGSDDPEVQPVKATRKHVRVKTGTTAFIPHDILKLPKLVSLASRMKISPVQQAAFTEAIIEEAAGDSIKINTSYSYADKMRREANRVMAKTSQDSWQPPQLASLHWDEKMMSALDNQYENDECLVVAVSDGNDIKVLGIPSYRPMLGLKAGETIMNLSHDLLVSWNCSESVRNMVFDTTASNTGHLSGACIKIQQRLGRALLWSACTALQTSCRRGDPYSGFQ